MPTSDIEEEPPPGDRFDSNDPVHVDAHEYDSVYGILLRTPASPTVTTAPGENGFQFVFIEFTPGDYLPEGPPHVPEPRLRLRSSSRSQPAEPPAQLPASRTVPMAQRRTCCSS